MSTPHLVSYILLWLLVLTLLVAVFALYHHFGTMYMTSREGREDQGPRPGRQIDAFTATDTRGREHAFPALDQPMLLVFASTSCSICAQLRDGLRRIAAARPQLSVVVLCDGHPRGVAAWAEDLPADVTVIPDPRARRSARMGVSILPFSVAVGSDGHVRAVGIVNDFDGLELAAHEAINLLPADISTESPH